ncbi:MAG: ROK family transcriptional regulator [Ardenticatenaceae bacterium]|nr:ROK family transcriptional regulator [Anaerolineales bacterium]MCB8938717.1 ROK family transcriptional regulator [Ardenticatenaceae bacterium]MCB8973953.1 ROK family transcriptional regulator [Ardenticatenaceae bacterium]
MKRSQAPTKKATRQHTKQHNARLVLKTIYDAGDVSRADLARLTGLTRATVSNIVAGYLDKGIVAETGVGPSIGGKPPILLSMVPNARQLICLDLGSEQFTGALVNLRGHFEQQISLPVNGRTAQAALDLVYELVDQLLSHVTAPVLGMALGSPGLIDADAGLVKQSVNLDWHDLPLQQLLADRYAFPVHIANDSHLAALAEYSYGNDDTRNLVLIKMGQGIGSGIVLNGRIFYGEGFGAGEIGHVSVVADGEQCSCGNVGCLETVASVRAMLRQVEMAASQNPDSLLATNSPITWEILRQACQQGDATAQQIVTQAGDFLGLAVANLVGILNVNRIVIAGDVAQTGDLFIGAVKNSMNRRVLPKLAVDTAVQYATTESNLVLLGASALILSQGLGVI